MTPWWSSLAPVACPVGCAGQDHEVRWRDGAIAAPAHPEIQRERALSALGGNPPPCVQIVDAWARHVDDLDLLMLASRGPGDRLEAVPAPFAGPAAAHHGFGSYRPLSSPPSGYVAAYLSSRGLGSATAGWSGFGHGMPGRHSDGEDGSTTQLRLLLSLGSGLPHRLSVTVIATWAERIETDDARVAAATPALDAALYGRVRATLGPWLGAAVNLRLTMQPPGSEPTVRRDGADLHLGLPFAWLRDVWANGLAVVLDRFCLQARQTAPRSWTLTTVDRDLTAPHRVAITG